MHGWYLNLNQTSRAVGTVSTDCPASGEGLESVRSVDRRRRSAITDASEMGLETREEGLGAVCSGSHPVDVSEGRVDQGRIGARGNVENPVS